MGSGSWFEVVFWPEQGQYANETYFATMAGAIEHLQFRVDQRPVREVALFSDGLQRLVLKFDTREPFEPFFRNMFCPVRGITRVSGEAHELSSDLAAYLGSAHVSERTDDDISLILATQRGQAEEPEAASPSTRAPDAPEPVPPEESGAVTSGPTEL